MMNRFHIFHAWDGVIPSWMQVWPRAAARFCLSGRRDFWWVDFWSLNFVLNGKVRFETARETVMLTSGTAFITRPRQRFRYYAPDGLMEIVALQLTGPGTGQFLQTAGFGPDSDWLRPADPTQCVKLSMALLHAIEDSTAASCFRIAAYLNEIAVHLAPQAPLIPAGASGG